MTLVSILTRARQGLDRGFQWWIGTLAEMIPAALRDLFADEPITLLIEIDAEEVRIRSPGNLSVESVLPRPLDPHELERLLASAIAERAEAKAQVGVTLGPDLVFRRDVTLPASGANDLRAILAHEIDRLTPIAAIDACYATRIADRRDDGTIVAELIVTERNLIASIGAAARRASVDITRIGLAEDPEVGIDLAIDAKDPTPHWKRLPGPAWLCVAALLVATSAAIVTLERLDAAVLEAKSRLAQLRTEARKVDLLAKEVAALEAQRGALAVEKARPGPIVILGDLAERLPSDSWLASVFLNQKELRIAGWSRDAARLPPTLDASPYLEQPRFTAPVTRDNVLGIDRFELSMGLKAGAIKAGRAP